MDLIERTEHKTLYSKKAHQCPTMNILIRTKKGYTEYDFCNPVVAWTHSKSHRLASSLITSWSSLQYTKQPNSPSHASLAVAPTRPLSLVRLRPEVNALSLLARSQVPGSRLVDGQFLRDSREELLHVLACLGRRLEEEEAGFAGVLLGVGGGDGALVGGFGHEIEFVAGEGDDNVFVGLALEFFDPGFCFVEGGLGVLVWGRWKVRDRDVRPV